MGDDSRIWVGGLPERIEEDEIREVYEKFGKISSVQIRNNNGGTSFAFVQYSDKRDAEDAIKRTDQEKLFGMPFVKVAWPSAPGKGRAKGRPRSRSRSPPPRRRSVSSRRDSPPPRRGSPPRRQPPRRSDSRRPPRRSPPPSRPPWRDDDGDRRGRSRSPPPRRDDYGDRGRSGGGGGRQSRTPPPRSSSRQRPSWWQPKPSEVQGSYRVKIEKLPEDMGWQELKSLGASFAKRGSCTFSRTNRDQTGVLEFTSIDDMRKAIDELDGRRFEGARDRLVAYEDKSKRW